MHDATRRFRVGLLVLGTGSLFVALLFFVAGTALQRDTQTHFIRFDESVKGMVVGSKVNFQGVPIGAVSDIRFEAGLTLVEIQIDPKKASLQDVTRARIDRLLVTGQVTIELEGYQSGAQSLADGSLIRAESHDPIAEIKSSLPAVLQNVDRLLERSTALVARAERFLADDNQERVARILEKLETVLDAVPGELSRTGEELRATLAAFRPLATDARATLERISALTDNELAPSMESLRVALGAIGRGALALEATAAAFERVALETQGILGGNRGVLRGLLVGASDAMRELRAFARQIRAAPQSLVFGAEDHEIDLPATPPKGQR